MGTHPLLESERCPHCKPVTPSLQKSNCNACIFTERDTVPITQKSSRDGAMLYACPIICLVASYLKRVDGHDNILLSLR